MLPLLQSPNFYGRAEKEEEETRIPQICEFPCSKKKTKNKLLMVAPKLLISGTGFLKKTFK